jgi:hypothetical protein
MIPLTLSLNNSNKKIYMKYSTLIQKHVSGYILCLAVDIAFLMLMLQILTVNPLLVVKNFELTHLCKALSYTNIS